jgi:protein TonB
MNFQPLCYSPDLVFEGRNKAYGAYHLRKIYEKRMVMAVILAILIFSMAMGGPVLYNNFAPQAESDKINDRILNTTEIPPAKEEEKIVPPPPPPTEIKQPPVKTIAFLPPTPSHEKPDEMPKQEDFKKALPSDKTQDGETTDVDREIPQVIETVTPAVIDKPAELDDKPYMVAQEMPEYVGGAKAMQRFLERNFNYPNNPKRMGIEGKVFVRFVVRKDGSIDDVTVVKGIANCEECNQEATRIVRKMPKWKAGAQNGNPVAVYFTLPIVFKIQ